MLTIDYSCKYETGWYVKVKKDLIVGKTYNKLPFLEQMKPYLGNIYQIESGFYSFLMKRYFLKDIPYEFSEEMLELPELKEIKKIKATTNYILDREIKAKKRTLS